PVSCLCTRFSMSFRVSWLILCFHLSFFLYRSFPPPYLPSFPTRRSSDLLIFFSPCHIQQRLVPLNQHCCHKHHKRQSRIGKNSRSEEHTSELQSRFDLVCRLLLEKKKKITPTKLHYTKR